MAKSDNEIPDNNKVKKRGQRIEYVRKKLLGLSRTAFCKGFSWTDQSLKAWELGWGGGLHEEKAKALVQHLKKLGICTSVSWLMHGIGMAPTALTTDLDISEEEEDHIAKELLLFREIPGAMDAIIEDSSMMPALYPGDYVGGILVTSPLSVLDRQCIVVDASGHTHIRTIEAGDKENFYHLTCLNKDTNFVQNIKNISVQKVAPIVWVRRRKPK